MLFFCIRFLFHHKDPKCRKIPFFFIIPSLFFASQPGYCLQIGNYKILSQVALERGHNDNIYLKKEDKENYNFSRITPDISIMNTSSTLKINFHYQADYYRNDHFSNENRNYQTGNWDIQGKLSEKTLMGITGQDDYTYRKLDERENLLQDSNNVIKTNNLITTFYMNQEIGKKCKTSFSYSFSERDLSGDQGPEKNRKQQGKIDFEYKIKNELSIESGYTHSSYDRGDPNSDFTEKEISAGISWDSSQKLNFSALYGCGWREENSSKKNTLDQDNKYTILNLKLNMNSYPFTFNTSYVKSSQNISTHDTRDDFFLFHDVSLNLGYDFFQGKVNLRCIGQYTLADYEISKREDESLIESLQITWRIGKSLLLASAANYSQFKYQYIFNEENEDRKDTSWSEQLSLEWNILPSVEFFCMGKYTEFSYHTIDLIDSESFRETDRVDKGYEGRGELKTMINEYFSFYTQYRYVKNKSPLSANEYVNNIYTFGLKITF